MLMNRKRIYMLGTYTVEYRNKGWFYRRTYSEDDWRGPFTSETSVCLMIARQLMRELVKRDGLPT